MTSPFVLTSVGYGCIALITAEFYLLPVMIGWVRRVPRLHSIAVIDIALGWTVIGWALALVLALKPTDSARPLPRRAPLGAGSREPSAAPPLVVPPPSAGGHASG